ncbi:MULTISPECIES: pyruvate, phosphate dikinase [Clostridium]|jgi:pyruvate,orthophosphate dikinase|uniref:Pyruvate, phosphate dikinase n=2 Tax=Clostridium TaxID=1485 RepID=A0A2T3FLL3_9CLOT|nr:MULTISPECIES: pyruvate, phosphate dikinase [Clostridium]MCC2169433.1 pyruvate, phosphate dikinase [Clostridium fessum]MDR4025036.1 pyruvate, phosphate dikinase [Clostridium sp.]PST36159.1 pyruvate, phosphate dikinase [Clostridium fessum]RHO11360.1 pyruvate, phosphate dikinase [Clostridium sp. AM18-55]RHP43414.1 pyruvate, phosphate dikinase [Clostridium sp. AF32-7AC]
MAKWVYMFSEGDMTMRNLLGGKGANLAEMTSIGLPVPQGFTITTEACTQYYEDGRKINDEIMAQTMEGVKKMEELNGKKFGDLKNPLLVSVRSGARASMPGMMDTILNLGLNDEVVAAMIAGNPDPKFERFVYDSYRRFIQMFSDVVMEVGKKYFEQLIDKMKAEKGVHYDIELTAADLKTLAEQFKAEYKKQLGEDFPSDPVVQLKLAIEAVFRSWDNPRANVYRRDNDIPYSWGTAVNVMPMVFGNLNDESGTGVAFTRDPATGEKKLMGEFLKNAQGEDVVAGVRTPMPIAQMEQEFPEAYADFIKVCDVLENHYHDMQDMEFTVENKKLYMLQCRNGKRTAQAALQIACDLVDEGHKTEEEAVAMIDPRNLDTLLHPQFDAAALKAATPLGKGLGASPGAACGKVVFTAEDAEKWAEKGEKVILVRLETSPEDITGMKVAQGILTVRGGMTSHAAVVARGMGTCCVSGCGDIAMDEENKKFTLAGKVFNEGDFISIDGTTGNIYEGEIKTVDATIAGTFGRVMAWADKFRRLKVRTNADTPADAKKARELGAEGIGLCRTEHMFFEEDRIAAFREMICADTVEEREAALDKILPYQQGDFEGLFEALEGNPVTIRFLDPPLHEFVPTEEEDIKKLADAQGKSVEFIKNLIASLHEFNPMMGHRGLRLAVTYPEIAVMQTKAVIRAAINVQKAHADWSVKPEIMIPLACDAKELKYVKDIVVKTADEEIAAAGVDLKYEVGTMIEIPRAALTADDIAKEAEFFCFGTNDLTQMTYGFSRDDAGKFLNAYYDKKIFESDPFAKLDQTGVGKLMEMAIKLGKAERPTLHVGICGEHGGDPSSVEFCHKIGLDYVSCSPFRVPIARLAAAQAAIAEK